MVKKRTVKDFAPMKRNLIKQYGKRKGEDVFYGVMERWNIKGRKYKR